MDEDFVQGMWIAEKIRGKYLQKDVETWKNLAMELSANVKRANNSIVELAAIRDAYKSLSTEMVLELKSVKPRRFSLPDADEARVEHLEEVRRLSLAKHTEETERQVEQGKEEFRKRHGLAKR